MTRQHTPSPYHDALLAQYRELNRAAPSHALKMLADRHGMTPILLQMVLKWTAAVERREPCPESGMRRVSKTQQRENR